MSSNFNYFRLIYFCLGHVLGTRSQYSSDNGVLIPCVLNSPEIKRTAFMN